MFGIKKEKAGYKNLSNPNNRQSHQELHVLMEELYGNPEKKKRRNSKAISR